MPETIRAEVMGMCPGVSRALDLAIDANHSERHVSTLGPIVHNRDVTSYLAELGIEQKRIDEIGDSDVVVSRSHGLSRDDERLLNMAPVDLVDGTCPKVTRIHRIAERAEAEDALLVVIGDPEHAEVRGIVSRCRQSVVLTEPSDITNAALNHDKIVVVTQTTFGRERFEKIASRISAEYPHAKITDTICREVDARIASVQRLAVRVDAIVVVGGHESSNTRQIFRAAAKTGMPCWHVATATDVPDEVFQFQVVGISAGASTPEWVIAEVERRIESCIGGTTE